MPRRVVHHNWVYQSIGLAVWDQNEISERRERICEAVRTEISLLSDSEREFMELYWFQGNSASEIARILQRKRYNLENLNRCIMRKLKNRLSKFVEEEFGIRSVYRSECVICCHPEIEKINQQLRSRAPDETYRRLIRLLKTDYGIDIKTPQTIIGHLKYHTREES
jgi:hypothetical protein